MKHEFRAGIAEPSICAVCKYKEIDHTNRATCECCGNTGTCDIVYGNVLMCLDCQDKEAKAQAELKATAESRVEQSRQDTDARAKVSKAQQIDHSIQIIQDIFNAETVAIVEIRDAIDNDASITEKHFTLAKSLEDRHTHFQSIIDAARDTLTEAQSKQRAIQQYYNELANKLRVEEREKIKLKDVNYKPIEKAKVSKPKAPSVKKLDKAELIRTANSIAKEFPQVPVNLIMPNLQTLVISKNMTLEAAANVLKGMFGGKL